MAASPDPALDSGSDRPTPSGTADLVAVVALVLSALAATLLPFLAETPLRAVLGFAFVLLAPGYALVAALFPARPTADEDAPGGPARAALSVLSSVVLAAVVGGSLSLTVGLGEPTAVVALSAVTLLLAGVALSRRRALPPADRFDVPFRSWAGTVRTALTETETRGETAMNVLLVVVVVVAAAGVTYATAVPGNQERFTEFYLLTEDADGDLVATDYPTEFTVGEPRSQYVGLTNREGETVAYTVVVQLQRVGVTDDGVVVREREELRRFTPEVSADERWLENHTVTPTMAGDRLRLTYLLYRGAPPATPTVENANEFAYTWVNVSVANGTSASASVPARLPMSSGW
jgi:uncharacterized membrane protein